MRNRAAGSCCYRVTHVAATSVLGKLWPVSKLVVGEPHRQSGTDGGEAGSFWCNSTIRINNSWIELEGSTVRTSARDRVTRKIQNFSMAERGRGLPGVARGRQVVEYGRNFEMWD